MKNVGSYMKFIAFIIFTLSLILAPVTNAGNLSASVDRFRMGEDETLTLSIIYDDANVSGQPNLAGLESIFEIISSGSSAKTSISNGKVASSKTWRYTLVPKKTGKFFIPSFSIDNSYSEPIEIEVLDNATINTTDGSSRGDLFVQAAVNKREAYLQEMITLTLRIYTSVQIAQPKLPELNLSGFMVEKIGESQFETREADRNYYVLEYRYALFAQQSGELHIPKQRYQIAQVISNGPRSLFNVPGLSPQTQARFVSTAEIPIRIKTVPNNNPVDYWLTGDDITVTDNWMDEQNIDIGTPITRSIDIKVLGNQAANIPPLPEQTLSGLKTYREQAVLSNARAGDNLLATRTENMAIVGVTAGHYILPEIRVHWWSNKEKQFKISIIPQRRLVVKGTEPITTNVTPLVSSSNTRSAIATDQPRDTTRPLSSLHSPLYLNVHVWMGISTALLFMWLITVAFLLKKNRSILSTTGTTSIEDIKICTKALKQACLANDAKQARSALIAWAQQQWPVDNILTLQDIKRKIVSQAFNAMIDDLDAALYRDATIWSGKPLIDYLKSSQFSGFKKNNYFDKKRNALPDLYS